MRCPFTGLARSLTKHGFFFSYRTFFIRRTKNVRYEKFLIRGGTDVRYLVYRSRPECSRNLQNCNCHYSTDQRADEIHKMIIHPTPAAQRGRWSPATVGAAFGLAAIAG